jgi:hypothetical protein
MCAAQTLPLLPERLIFFSPTPLLPMAIMIGFLRTLSRFAELLAAASFRLPFRVRLVSKPNISWLTLPRAIDAIPPIRSSWSTFAFLRGSNVSLSDMNAAASSSFAPPGEEAAFFSWRLRGMRSMRACVWRPCQPHCLRLYPACIRKSLISAKSAGVTRVRI